MLIYDYIIKDFMLFNKKKDEPVKVESKVFKENKKVVASAPQKKEVKKCKFHKSHDRHCITCNQ